MISLLLVGLIEALLDVFCDPQFGVVSGVVRFLTSAGIVERCKLSHFVLLEVVRRLV